MWKIYPLEGILHGVGHLFASFFFAVFFLCLLLERRREERGGVVEQEGSANVVELFVFVGCCFCLFEDIVRGCFFLVGAGAEVRDLEEEFRDAAADGGQAGGGRRHYIFNGGFPAPATVTVVVAVAEVLDGLHWASLHF